MSRLAGLRDFSVLPFRVGAGELCRGSDTAMGIAAKYADRVAGRVFIVTGANSGCGKETARALAAHGGTVVMACRSLDRGRAALADVRESAKDADVRLLQLDLSDLVSVRAFCKEFVSTGLKLDVLINNAGVMGIPNFQPSAQGWEMHFATNHVGHFLLTKLLAPKLQETPGSRVVNLSSEAHRLGTSWSVEHDLPPRDDQYGTLTTGGYEYGISKLCNILHARKVNTMYKIDAFSVHPGMVDSDLGQHNRIMGAAYWLFGKTKVARSVGSGAATSVHCALAPEATPGYYYNCGQRSTTAAAQDEQRADAVWSLSEQLVEPWAGPL